ncbi:hypothetical protein L6452_39233 [Arctium lappa]|uniref:Uncharacterized protein n=1 Tax=Arctium lappa TaxID=4217 RepID=A0ACB8XS95_ARCLA|nr:hypothetical protein L6452_39233 [Arctium lappa]
MTRLFNKEQHVGIYPGFKVLGLPYLQGKDKQRFTMYLFLPNAKHGLPSLIEKIATSGSDFLERHLPNEMLEVGRFLIPKFKISFAFEASEMLEELGLVLPFSTDGEGELTEMVEGGNGLYVSSIHLKSFVEVNEQGIEAAAASEAILMLQSLTTYEVNFVADHPFLFVIREDTTGVVVFMGQEVDSLYEKRDRMIEIFKDTDTQSLKLSNNGDEDAEKNLDIQLWDNPDLFDTGLSPYQVDEEICNDDNVVEEDSLHDDLSHGFDDDQSDEEDVMKQNDEKGGMSLRLLERF